MKKLFHLSLLVALVAFTLSTTTTEWGFFAHRRINRLAVFTLPPEMAGYFKKNIEFITEHAVDPDKRRYAVKGEGIRHYIDIDHWGTYPFPEVPRKWTDALIKYTGLYAISGKDTLRIERDTRPEFAQKEDFYAFRDSIQGKSWLINKKIYRQFFSRHILPQYQEDEWIVNCDTLARLLKTPLACDKVIAVDYFSEYGIVPYNLVSMKRKLTNAFRRKDSKRILRLSAEIGHYVADASVPLHTTENYNGQMTNQIGIHGFWESRLPELFADETYDYFVGPANYIEDTRAFFWDRVLTSHAMLDSVLTIEKYLSQTYPKDQQFCYEERLDIIIRTQCRAYAAAYHDHLHGMVEKRMRSTILAVGSTWYTCWVDAGQPDLSNLQKTVFTKKELREMEELDKAKARGHIYGRKHED